MCLTVGRNTLCWSSPQCAFLKNSELKRYFIVWEKHWMYMYTGLWAIQKSSISGNFGRVSVLKSKDGPWLCRIPRKLNFFPER